MSLLDDANKAALDQVRAEKPQSFTVGGSFDGKKLQGGVTFQRTWANGLGLTAYLYAYWNDLTISTHTKRPNVAAGVEAVKRF